MLSNSLVCIIYQCNLEPALFHVFSLSQWMPQYLDTYSVLESPLKIRLQLYSFNLGLFVGISQCVQQTCCKLHDLSGFKNSFHLTSSILVKLIPHGPWLFSSVDNLVCSLNLLDHSCNTLCVLILKKTPP